MRNDFHDRLEARDWRRPWRSPPGFFLPGCDCCASGCTPVCGPGAATVGTVGTESGSECTSCGTQVIFDSFSGALDPAWVGQGTCPGNGIGPFGAHIIGGVLDMGFGSGVIRSFPRPALAGFCVQVKAKLATLPSSGAFGITLGYGRLFFARPLQGTYGRQAQIDVNGCVQAGSDFQAFSPVPANGDIISMVFRDQGNADGVCSICYQVNGTTIRVEEDVQCCFDCTMWAGISFSTGSGAQADDFEVRTS